MAYRLGQARRDLDLDVIVGVNVDETRRQPQAVEIARFPCGIFDAGSDTDDAAVTYADVGVPRRRVGPVEDETSLQ